MSGADALRQYVRFYETLTPQSLNELERLCDPQVRFRDPFNDVRGVAAYRRVLEKMFEETRAPSFVVLDSAEGRAASYLRWRFTCQIRGKALEIDGMSEVSFDSHGRVVAHIDHWDAGGQVYEKVPLVGTLLRVIRRRLSAA